MIRRVLALVLVALFVPRAAPGMPAPGAARAFGPERNGAGFANANRPHRFVFPRDHGSHPAFQTEWWYFTGHLLTRDGRRFGYELTFFRFGLRPGDPRPLATQSRWRGNELFPAHFAITDERGGTFFHTEKFTREAIGIGGAATDRLAVHAEDWTLAGTPLGDRRKERMRLLASAAPNAIDLEQLPLKPPAVHGHDGVSRKAACSTCASHYYSYTRLQTTGTLLFDGVRYPVRGLSWMDHEFGSSELQADQAGWDWYAIQLDDGRELMLYLLRRKDGSAVPESSGSLIERDGTVRYLPHEAFVARATGSWTSPVTHGVYPSGWHLDVPSAGLSVDVVPTIPNQELAFTSGTISYWEGSVDIRAGGGRSVGTGYVELTGYAGIVSL